MLDLTQLMTPEELCTRLGEKVRQIRISKNITQEGLALNCGLSKKAIINLEEGKSNLNSFVKVLTALELENKLLDILNVEPDKTIAEIKEQEKNTTRQRARPR